MDTHFTSHIVPEGAADLVHPHDEAFQTPPHVIEAIDAFGAARSWLEAALREQRGPATVLGRWEAMQRSAAAVRLATGLDIDLMHHVWEGR